MVFLCCETRGLLHRSHYYSLTGYCSLSTIVALPRQLGAANREAWLQVVYNNYYGVAWFATQQLVLVGTRFVSDKYLWEKGSQLQSLTN